MAQAQKMSQKNPYESTYFNMNEARFNMVEQQIRTWEVLDTGVLDLLTEVPREHFVDPSQLGLAFADLELPIGYGQTMLQPKIEGRILQALNIKKTDQALVIGTGSGYLTALIAKLAKQVDSIEIIPELSQRAQARLQKQNIENVDLYVADAFKNNMRHKTYDVITFAGSLQLYPNEAEKMLNLGGRMFVVMGEAPAMQATLIERTAEGNCRKETLFETCLAPLTNAPQSVKFNF